MVTLEYKLKGNEFKLLQYLKTLDNIKSQGDMAQDLYMSIRTVRGTLKTLKEYNVIEVGKSGVKVNDISLWDLEAYTTKKFKTELPKLIAQEELENGNKEESEVTN